MDFVAFDFETANAKRNSACSLALSVVRNGQIVDEFYSLINPQAEFAPTNIRIHGIRPADVKKAPTLAELWPHIQSFFQSNQLAVAHNASFDCSVLKRTLESYDITVPQFLVLDTLKTSRKFFADFPNQKLDTICQRLNISLKNHHNALADASACANILLYQANHFGSSALVDFIKTYPK